MKDEYDFSGMKSRKNPYAKKLKKQRTIRLAVKKIDSLKTLLKNQDCLIKINFPLY